MKTNQNFYFIRWTMFALKKYTVLTIWILKFIVITWAKVLENQKKAVVKCQ